MAFLVNENIQVAIGSIKSNLLRACLTMLIIAIGITALVGILSAIDAIKNSLNSNFTTMGANTFTIRNKGIGIRVGHGKRKPQNFSSITFKEALRFKQEYTFPATTSISTLASFAARLKYETEKTNPNIQVFGADENYLLSAGYEIEKGRNFSMQEVSAGVSTVLLGHDVAYALFKKGVSPLDKLVSIGSRKYRVIGVLKSKGNSMGFGGDKVCVIPIGNARQYFSRPDMTFTMSVLITNPQLMALAIDEAVGLFRKIRRVNNGDDDNFETVKSDSLATMLIENMQTVTLGATIIGIITLLGAAIGLMNIMLVSVTERTREIGIRKALGATQMTIKRQFLIESIVICVLGGLVGIIFGILIGNVISYMLGVGFFVPWFWIIVGVVICVVVGLASGYIPAQRASKLDPIESLRFE